jgi:hypothetical protein
MAKYPYSATKTIKKEVPIEEVQEAVRRTFKSSGKASIARDKLVIVGFSSGLWAPCYRAKVTFDVSVNNGKTIIMAEGLNRKTTLYRVLFLVGLFSIVFAPLSIWMIVSVAKSPERTRALLQRGLDEVAEQLA